MAWDWRPQRSNSITTKSVVELVQRAGSLTLPYRVVVRAKLVLLAANGHTNREIQEVVPFAVELRGGDPVISERLRA